MRVMTSLSVILLAAILALGDGAYLAEDNKYVQRANNEEMEEIQRALNQLKADVAAEPNVDENDMEGPTRGDAIQQMAQLLRLDGIKGHTTSDDNEQFLQELENQPSPLPEEQGPKAIIAGSGQIQHGDQVAFQVLGQKSKYLQCKGTYSWPTYCTQSTGPGMFMDSSDWGEYPSATFRIYRHRGKGAVRAGEVVAIYYPKQAKWMKCDSAWCLKTTCPGYPTTSHGMASDEKWHKCPQNVFKIYARGRKLGQVLRANDEILLYSLKYCKWVSVAGTWIAQGTCPGYHRPPASSKYDTCYKSVFELWKQ